MSTPGGVNRYFERIQRKGDGVQYSFGTRMEGDLSEVWDVGSNHCAVLRHDPFANSLCDDEASTTGGMCLARDNPNFKTLCSLYSEFHIDYIRWRIILGSPSYGNPDGYELENDLLSQDPFVLIGELRRKHTYDGSSTTYDKLTSSPCAFVSRTRDSEVYPVISCSAYPVSAAEKASWVRTNVNSGGYIVDFVEGRNIEWCPCFDWCVVNVQGRAETEPFYFPVSYETFCVCSFRGAKTMNAPV